VLADVANPFPGAPGIPMREVFDEQGDVRSPLAKGGHFEWHVEPVEEVRSESAIRHRGSQISIRRGNCRDLSTGTRRCRPWFGSGSDTAISTEDPPGAQAYPPDACEIPPPSASAPYLLPRIAGSPRMPHRGASIRRRVGLLARARRDAAPWVAGRCQ